MSTSGVRSPRSLSNCSLARAAITPCAFNVIHNTTNILLVCDQFYRSQFFYKFHKSHTLTKVKIKHEIGVTDTFIVLNPKIYRKQREHYHIEKFNIFNKGLFV